jgi:hypothetical protein
MGGKIRNVFDNKQSFFSQYIKYRFYQERHVKDDIESIQKNLLTLINGAPFVIVKHV